MQEVHVDPWSPEAHEEDESFPNRVYILDEILEGSTGADGLIVKKLARRPGELGKQGRGRREKNRRAYRRFGHFLARTGVKVHLEAYGYCDEEQQRAQSIVETHFENLRAVKSEAGSDDKVIGSTPEDYFAVIRQQPQGINGEDYYAYLAYLETRSGQRVPIAFFAGERLNRVCATRQQVGLYASITLRFMEALPEVVRAEIRRENLTKGAEAEDEGFSAIAQYMWLQVFSRLRECGVIEVDAGGSETYNLDRQKEELGGHPRKTHWVVQP
jgi:hypothetical protein